MSITVGDLTDPRCICGNNAVTYEQLSYTGGTLQTNGAGTLRTYKTQSCNFNQQNKILNSLKCYIHVV